MEHTNTQTNKGETMSACIDNLTIGEIKELKSLLSGGATNNDEVSSHLYGQYVIVRARDAGVHAGYLEHQSGRCVRLRDARRLWKWRAATGISLSDVAASGVRASDCRIAAVVSSQSILDACEVLSTSTAARNSITEATTYEP